MKKSLIFTFTLLFGIYSLFAQNSGIVPVKDTSSTYKPTQIINGNFDTAPYMAGAGKNNGTNGGWNTSENTQYQGSYFEYLSFECYGNNDLKNNSSGRSKWIEMCANNPACLSQDLTTYPGDVIRWTLDHGARKDNNNNELIQVEIGAPVKSGSSIIYPTGIGTSINTNIVQNSKATYSYSGVTGYNGYANSAELAKLKLNNSTYDDYAFWHTCKGVYIIPQGQTVTRFAFVSQNDGDPAWGNFLDNVTFSTLIGNLSAEQGQNGSVTVKGYWGETDSSKKIKIDIGAVSYDVNMTGINGNFMFTIPANLVGSATQLSVYHQDYKSAARKIAITLYQYEPLEYIYIDADKYMNIDIPYCIPNQDTHYSWELSFSDLTVPQGRCGAIVGVIKDGLRSGYFYTYTKNSTQWTGVNPKLRPCIGTDKDGNTVFPWCAIGGVSEKNTVTAEYTHSGSSGTYTISDTLGIIGSGSSGTWSGSYPVGANFTLTACTPRVFGVDPEANYEFCSFKFYNVKIYEEVSGVMTKKVDLIPVIRSSSNGKREVGVINNVDGSFISMPTYTIGVPEIAYATLNFEGGTVSQNANKKYMAQKGAKLENIPQEDLPVKNGYTFMGYYSEKNGKGTCYYDAEGKAVVVSENTSDFTLYAAWHENHGNISFTAWNSNNSLPSQSGTYVLSNDITLSSSATLPANTILCLNGHKINGTVVISNDNIEICTATAENNAVITSINVADGKTVKLQGTIETKISLGNASKIEVTGDVTKSNICIISAYEGIITSGLKTNGGNPDLGKCIYFKLPDSSYGLLKTKAGELKVIKR